MKKILLIAAIAATIAGRSQPKDSIIINAMRDELNRNMTELSYEGFEKPFYIHYTVNDLNEYEVAASLGALIRSSENRSRSKNVRVLVGNYEFNDESLDNNNFSTPEANEIQLPLDDDYFGIRRALWVTTDYIYKSAARKYKKNLETLKEKNKSISEMPHRRFAPGKPIKLFREVEAFRFDLSNYEKLVRNLSAIFSEYPSIDNSTVYLSFVDGYNYFVSSEKTVAKTPTRIASLQVFAQRKTEDGETIYDHLSYEAFTPGEFPTEDKIKNDIKKLCEKVSSLPLPVIDEEYNGPVLFVGQPVANAFASVLFGFREGLLASDILPDPRGFRQDPNGSLDAKIGKLIVHESLTVAAIPTTRIYNGLTLLGSLYIDDEGSVPPDHLVLVERGVLKGLLNNRSLIKENEVSNGHANGPAVIEVTAANGISLNLLKERLRAEAKKEGLEYGLMISSSSDDELEGRTVTKIFVADGKEEIMRGGVLKPLQLRDLKNVIGISSNLKAHNLRAANQFLTSYIVPEAILLEDVEIHKADLRTFREERYISSPLKQ